MGSGMGTKERGERERHGRKEGRSMLRNILSLYPFLLFRVRKMFLLQSCFHTLSISFFAQQSSLYRTFSKFFHLPLSLSLSFSLHQKIFYPLLPSFPFFLSAQSIPEVDWDPGSEQRRRTVLETGFFFLSFFFLWFLKRYIES